MPIAPFGWKDHGPPDIDAANLEAMLGRAGEYTDELAESAGEPEGFGTLDAEGRQPVAQLSPSVVNSSTVAFNVKNYGALGNGVHDDTAAIEGAITAAVSGGGIVLLPSGTFVISKPIVLPNNLTLEGCGEQNTVIELKAASNCDMLQVNVNNSAYLRLRGFMLNGNEANNPTGGWGLKAKSGNIGNTIEDVRAINCKAGGIGYLEGADRVVMKNVVAARNGGDGFRLVKCTRVDLFHVDAENNNAGRNYHFIESDELHIFGMGMENDEGEGLIGAVFDSCLDWLVLGFWALNSQEAGKKQLAAIEITNTTKANRSSNYMIINANSAGYTNVIKDVPVGENMTAAVGMWCGILQPIGTVEAARFLITVKDDIKAKRKLIAETDNVEVKAEGKGLAVKEGTNAKQGVSGAMVAGKVTVTNKAIGASTRLMLTRQAGGTQPGAVYESERVAGEKFVIRSTNAEDTGTVAYEMFEAA